MGKFIAVMLSLLMAIPQPLHMTTTYAEDNTSENAVVETAEPTETAGSEQNMQDSLIVQDSGTDSPEAESTPAATSTATSKDSDNADNQIAEKQKNTDADAVTAAQPAAPRARIPIMRTASASDLTGTAYAVFNDSTGELDFIRSTEEHTNGSSGSVTSISGNTYTGTVYTGFETNDKPYGYNTWDNPSPWFNIVSKVKNVKFIDAIRPLRCDCWFYDMSNCARIDVAKLDTSYATSMQSMFCECSALTSLDVTNFDTANVTDMSEMFTWCSKLTTLDVSNFDTAKVVNMSDMFGYCHSLTSLDLGNFNTSNVADMGLMFSDCSSLKSLNVTSFNTSKVTSMSAMFRNCSSLTSLDLGSFDTSNVAYTDQMFYSCRSLASLNLENFDTSKVTSMAYMFYDCSSLTSLDLENFNATKVGNMHNMFDGCPHLSCLTFGSDFQIPSSSWNVFSTPVETISGKSSTGQWGAWV